MIVDCHTHINFAAGDVEICEHLEASQAVDACIVHATCEGPAEDVNAQLSRFVGARPDKMVGFAVVDPRQGPVTKKWLKSQTTRLGLKGVVLYCCENGCHPTHSNAMDLYGYCAELSLPVFFHNGDPAPGPETVLEYAQPYLLDEIARTFQDLKIIIASMGFPFREQTLLMTAKHANVYADLTIRPGRTWQTYNTVVAAHEMQVMDKLLFGSGFPVGNAWECMETLLGFNMLLADTNLPTVPRGSIRSVIERDTLELLGIRLDTAKARDRKGQAHARAQQDEEA